MSVNDCNVKNLFLDSECSSLRTAHLLEVVVGGHALVNVSEGASGLLLPSDLSKFVLDRLQRSLDLKLVKTELVVDSLRGQEVSRAQFVHKFPLNSLLLNFVG